MSRANFLSFINGSDREKIFTASIKERKARRQLMGARLLLSVARIKGLKHQFLLLIAVRPSLLMRPSNNICIGRVDGQRMIIKTLKRCFNPSLHVAAY